MEEYKAVFGDLDVTPRNPAQERADAEAERARDRTKQLAMLAFAGGVTKSGGAGWEGIGEGFTNAASAYDKGFQRYQEALQDSANRYDSQADRELEMEKAMRTGAFSLTLERRKAAREQEEAARKEKVALITKLFDDEQKLFFPERKEGDLPLSPEEAEAQERRKMDFIRRRELGEREGKYVRAGANLNG